MPKTYPGKFIFPAQNVSAFLAVGMRMVSRSVKLVPSQPPLGAGRTKTMSKTPPVPPPPVTCAVALSPLSSAYV